MKLQEIVNKRLPEMGKDSRTKEDLTPVLEVLEEKRKQNKINFSALMQLGKLYLEEKRHDESFSCYKDAYNLYEEKPTDLLQQLALLCIERGDFKNSDRYFSEFLANDKVSFLEKESFRKQIDNTKMRVMSEKEEKLQRKQFFTTLGSLAGELAHEVNTPIALIRLLAEGSIKDLQDKNFTLEEIQENFGKILNAVNLMAEQVNFIRKNMKGKQVDKENIDLNSVIKNCFDFFDTQLSKNSIHVDYQLEKKLPLLLANPTQVGQIFINLIQNSKDSLEQVKDERKKEIKVNTSCIKNKYGYPLIQILFKDTGGGAQDIASDKIFEPFITTKTNGTGLGLSIVKDIVQGLGGSIQIIENSSLGVTFLIEISIEIKGEKNETLSNIDSGR